jgi:hypothetical protein
MKATPQVNFVRATSSWGEALTRFALAPASARPLAAFRIGISAVLLLQAWLLRSVFMEFAAGRGFVQRELADYLHDPMLPRLGVLVDYLAAFGVSERVCLQGVGILYVVSLLFLLCGGFTRVAAVAVCLLHWTLINTGYSGAYGADMYAHIFLFYLMLMPSGAAWSLDSLRRGWRGENSSGARLSLRLVQLHMCISYVASGLEKSTGKNWWNGEILWTALNFPGYSRFDFYWLADYPWIPTFLGLGTLVIETFYGIAVWSRPTRMLWVVATCSLHLGIAFFLRLPIFGLLMCVPTLALFGISAEPRRG